ncbi:MAG: hypothetical protein IPP82_15310 [Xanthomonadales bacterium]|nr:hypothetical protein [Xanthomonadales bacterium]
MVRRRIAATSLSRAGNGELSISVRFSDSERISLYSQESVNVSIPKPGTRSTLTDSYHWPAYSDTDSLASAMPVISQAVRGTRQRLTPIMLGNVRLAGLEPSLGGTDGACPLAITESNNATSILWIGRRMLDEALHGPLKHHKQDSRE